MQYKFPVPTKVFEGEGIASEVGNGATVWTDGYWLYVRVEGKTKEEIQTVIDAHDPVKYKVVDLLEPVRQSRRGGNSYTGNQITAILDKLIGV